MKKETPQHKINNLDLFFFLGSLLASAYLISAISEKQNQEPKLEDLEKELKYHLSNENYEKCAELRDRIETIKILKNGK